MSSKQARILKQLACGRSNEPQIVERRRPRAQTSFFSTSAFDYTTRALETGRYNNESSSESDESSSSSDEDDDDDDNEENSSASSSSSQSAASSSSFEAPVGTSKSSKAADTSLDTPWQRGARGRKRKLSAKLSTGDYVDDSTLALMLGDGALKSRKTSSRATKSPRTPTKSNGSSNGTPRATSRSTKPTHKVEKRSKPSKQKSKTKRKAKASFRRASRLEAHFVSPKSPKGVKRSASQANHVDSSIFVVDVDTIQSPPSKQELESMNRNRETHQKESNELLDELIKANHAPLSSGKRKKIFVFFCIFLFLFLQIVKFFFRLLL